MAKYRLDELLVSKGWCDSLEEARAWILAGTVWSDKGVRLDKAGTLLAEDAAIEVRDRRPEFKSRAGAKLAHALEKFGVSVTDQVVLDVGASTGGFTDCLLQRGARHVFAVDVGYGLLDETLRKDPRVTCLERTNARLLKRADLLTHSPHASQIDRLVMDVSFTSIRNLAPALRAEFPEMKTWLFLFKPQFEVPSKNVGPKGLVEDQAAIDEALATTDRALVTLGLHKKAGPESSPLTGKRSGNLELLLLYETI